KHGRDFNHMLTGQLLCPVDYKWADENVHAAIQEYHPNFHITTYSWPLFLYSKGEYNVSHPVKSLFQGKLLVQAFQYIFTLLHSAQEEQESTITE
ncbi:hypothetical protein HD554DRAFT_2026202, partial [Boletus coccyginus]